MCVCVGVCACMSLCVCVCEDTPSDPPSKTDKLRLKHFPLCNMASYSFGQHLGQTRLRVHGNLRNDFFGRNYIDIDKELNISIDK